jgi:hypothetical protein
MVIDFQKLRNIYLVNFLVEYKTKTWLSTCLGHVEHVRTFGAMGYVRDSRLPVSDVSRREYCWDLLPSNG